MRKRIFTKGIPVSAVILVVIAACLGLLVLPDCARLKIIVINSTTDNLENVSVTDSMAPGYAHWSGRLRPGDVQRIRITARLWADVRLRGTNVAAGREFDERSFYASTDLFPGRTFLFLVEDHGIHTAMWEADKSWIALPWPGSLFLQEMACLDHVIWSELKSLMARLLDTTK